MTTPRFAAASCGCCSRWRGFALTSFDSPEKSLEAIRAEVPDVLITNLWFRNRDDGLELIRSVRQDPAMADVSVIAGSGDDSRLAQLRATFQDLRCEVLRKPFGLERLIEAVKSKIAPSSSTALA